MPAWYHPVRLVSFCPQNPNSTARKNTRYTLLSGSGTLGDEIFHCVVREKFLELPVKLRRQGFVVGDDQRRLVQRLDDVGHGEGLAGTGDTQ